MNDKMTDQANDSPAGLVVEEFQIVALHVEEAEHEAHQQTDHDWGCVVRRTQNTDLNLRNVFLSRNFYRYF